MEGTYLYSPFYPKAGGGATSAFRILSFTNDSNINERGIPLPQITFNWSYAGIPTAQSITPFIGNIPASQRSFVLTGQPIADTITFTLTASDSDGSQQRTATTEVKFVDPIFYGTVLSTAPSKAEILGMNKHIALYEPLSEPFRVSLTITDEHSCFASPMTNPITDIVETVFGLSVLGTYTIIENVPLTMVDGLIVLYRVYVKKVPEHTLGQNFLLNVIF